ncbi:MAG: nickel transporter [Rhizobacter sp.]|nr:nickel transporter [Rhizobacter sp.]
MNVIPVIDLLHGQVVRAVRGDRQHYRPIASALCASSDPLSVARTLCEYCAARQLYVADLDALQGGVGHVAVVRQLLEALPGIELWLDAGFADVSQAQALCAGLGPMAERLVPVFGSESLRSRAALEACFTSEVRRQGSGILSLDRRNGERLDAAGCWESPALWPARVIVMTLERVGAGTGPDLATLRGVAALSPRAQLIGAGGIDSEADLALAREAGASAWLVASALHDLKLARRSV